ncbi:MAG: flagellar basal body L-ring protein FlgH [Deltaproteobacteria bacterium]|nr:flagellar basal body L-ring protein FlgH [Deltaproteobacteria bacterium]
MKRMLALGAMGLVFAACGPSHIRPFTPRTRNYRPGHYDSGTRPVSQGSLWQENGRALFADFRATRVGDLVTIRIDETPQASGDASTQTDRESSMTAGATSLLGITTALQRAYPALDPTQLINLATQSQFDATGETGRSSRVRASIAVRVKRHLPNGDLYVEGTKVLLVNEEELHIYISGVIRPEDIEQDNSVRSSLIADAEVEFTGRGILTDNQQQGWLSRLLSSINPF